jgi:hypothetical protein
MSPHAINYSNTIFYRIVCNDLNITDCYIGHTTNFISRKRNHKKDCNSEISPKYNYKLYQFIRDNGGWNNWSMIMIEQISCKDFIEASKIEREFIEKYKSNLNSNNPSKIITKEETINKPIDEPINENIIKNIIDENMNILKDYNKNYYNNNIDKRKEYNKKLFYCDCCKKNISICGKSSHLKSKNHILNENSINPDI